MVHRLDAADLAALAFIKGMDGLTPGMWLQLQGHLMGKEERPDHEELSKLVKNILDSTTATPAKEGSKFTPFLRLPPNITKISPELVKLLENGKPTELPKLAHKTDKTDPKLPNQVETTLVKEKTTEKVVAQKPMGAQEHHRTEERGLKSQHVPTSQPMQHAVKEVVKAMSFLNPAQDNDVERTTDTHKSTASPKSAIQPSSEMKESEFMAKQKAPDQKVKTEKQEAPKSEFHPSFHTRTEAKPLSKHEFIRQEPKVTQQPKEEKQAPLTPQAHQHKPLEKRGEEFSAFLGSKSAPQESAQNQARPADRNTLPAAPFPTQFSTAESRRKEKRKYPHYFSDMEEGEEDQQNNDPNQKKR